jgi:general secretion pathway protein K
MKRDETGAALLSVLVLVGIMGAIAVAVFDRLRLATTLARNAAGLEVARAYGLVGEALLTARIDDLLGSTARTGDWQGRPITLPLPQGIATVRLRDGASCFNLNSLVTASGAGAGAVTLVTRPAAVAQFIALLQTLDIPEATARRLAGATADWIDSDSIVGPDGAEDESYARARLPYRTGNVLLAETSEWRAVLGVAAVYERLRPWVCALPVAELSPVNVNMLAPAQAPLLAMLLPPPASLDTARRALAERPRGGWDTVQSFWNTPALRSVSPVGEAIGQPRVRTVWLTLAMDIDAAGSEMTETALIDARRPPSRVVARRWTADE